MARLKSLNETWKEYAGWVFLIITVYALWTFRKVFSTVGGAVGDAAAAATSGIVASSAAKTDTAKVKAAVPNIKSSAITSGALATWRSDAGALANYLGQGPMGLATVFKDQQSAFTLIKQKYSRLRLHNNKPCEMVYQAAGLMTVKDTLAETTNSIKNDVNWRVLAPFYYEITEGRNLESDFRYFVTGSAYKPFLKWIL